MNSYNRFSYFLFINILLTISFVFILFFIGLIYLETNILGTYHMPVITSIFFLITTQYKLQLITRKLTWFMCFRIFFSWFLVFILTSFVLFLFKQSEQFSRVVISLSYTLMPFVNIGLLKILFYLNKLYFTNDKTILVIGNQSHGIEEFLKDRNYNNISFIDSKDVNSIKMIIDKDSIDIIILSFGDDFSTLSKFIKEFRYSLLDVFMVTPNFLRTDSYFLKYFDINFKDKIKIDPINTASINSSFSGPFLKRSIDIVLSLIAIILLLPIFIIVTIMIRIESNGPVFFIQERVGFNRSKFKILKFRSMYMHTEKDITQAKTNDSRITKVGNFIRKTSIDELPQLLNVLIGDMSLVGPRPHATQHDDKYSEEIIDYISRLKVKPGITGLAQVMGYRGETEHIFKMKQRVKYDVSYIQDWSLLLDILIILYTPYSLIKNKAH